MDTAQGGRAGRRMRAAAGGWLARANAERLRRLTRLSAWIVRLLAWREPAHQWLTTLRTLPERSRAAFRLAYYVAPHALLRPARPALALSPTVRLIVNPASGGVHGGVDLALLRQTAVWLGEHGMPAEVCLTSGPGDATRLASEAVSKHLDLVVAVGGDGTVNGVIQALAGHDTALGVLPMGTVNVWAREMGISMNVVEARELLLHGARRRVDLGRAGSRYFLLMAGVGFDAEVARRVDRGPLKRIGLKLLHYITTAGVLSVTQSPTRVRMRFNGKRRSYNALMILIGNTRLYGGALSFTNRAVADDGLLDLVVVENGGLLYRLGVLGRALLRRASLGPRVRYRQARAIRVDADEPLPVQVDGEVIGTLPMTFSVAAGALTVVVPRDAQPRLFQHAPLPNATPRDLAGDMQFGHRG
ncbi:MAG TPA: diacylglycerol kinase family protein [Ktedonobacterales bacterium]